MSTENKAAYPKPTGLSQGWNLTRKHDGFVIGHQSAAYPPDAKAIERAERDGYVWVPFLVPAAQHQGEPVACMPVERCYDVRAKMIIAFNEAKKAGGDLDDALDAAYKSALRYSPNPLSAEQPAPAAVALPIDPERERLMEIVQQYPNVDPLKYDAAVRTLRK